MENLEQQLKNDISSKEYKDILKTLDTKEWKDTFLKLLFESKENITEFFWKDIFKEQFWESTWNNVLNSLLIFCKNIDKKEFSKIWISQQYYIAERYLKSILWEIDLYKEIWLINTYINYDISSEETIKIDTILSNWSEEKLNLKEGLEDIRIARFAYADIEISKTWNVSILDNSKANEKELFSIIEVNKNTFKIKDIPESQLTSNQKFFKEYLANAKNDLIKKIDNENYEIIIDWNNKNQYLRKNDLENNLHKSDFSWWIKGLEIKQNSEIQISEETTLLSILLTIFSKYDVQQNIKEYNDDYNEIIKDKYIIKEQIKDSSWFSAIIMEEKNTWNIIITIRGTNDLIDILFSDSQIWLMSRWVDIFTPSQIKPLKELLEKVNNNYPWKNIKTLWHSLWWYLSEISEWIKETSDNIKTMNINWPGWWDLKWIDKTENVWKNCIKIQTNETISTTWIQTNRYLIAAPWNEHSVNSVIENIQKLNISKEWNLPVIDLWNFRKRK